MAIWPLFVQNLGGTLRQLWFPIRATENNFVSTKTMKLTTKRASALQRQLSRSLCVSERTWDGDRISGFAHCYRRYVRRAISRCVEWVAGLSCWFSARTAHCGQCPLISPTTTIACRPLDYVVDLFCQSNRCRPLNDQQSTWYTRTESI